MSCEYISQSVELIVPRQGVEIRTYQDMFDTLSPKITSNSNKKRIKEGYVANDSIYFDDSNNSRIASLKREEVPTHQMEQRDLGFNKTFEEDKPFFDIPVGRHEQFITRGESELLYPIVLNIEEQKSPGDLNGVLEPFVIRSQATRQNHDFPYSMRRTRGAVSNYSEDPFGFCVPIEQAIYFSEEKRQIRPFNEFGDDANRPVDQRWGYFSDEIEEYAPYNEDDDRKKLTKEIDIDMANLLGNTQNSTTAVGKRFKSSTSGYTFIDNQNGTDSIVFLDKKGY